MRPRLPKVRQFSCPLSSPKVFAAALRADNRQSISGAECSLAAGLISIDVGSGCIEDIAVCGDFAMLSTPQLDVSAIASDIDPFSREFLADPYPYHERLR